MSWRKALSKNLQELRIHLCQTGEKSQGARDFVHNSYQELKKANPTLPILIRECSGIQARMIARYDYGVEEAVSIDGIDQSAITQKLKDLVIKGETMPKSADS